MVLINSLINVIRKKYNSCDGGISNIILINTLLKEKCETYAALCETKALNPRSKSQETLLHMAVSTSSSAREPVLVQYLCQLGFKTTEKNNEGQTPLHLAASKVGDIQLHSKAY